MYTLRFSALLTSPVRGVSFNVSISVILVSFLPAYSISVGPLLPVSALERRQFLHRPSLDTSAHLSLHILPILLHPVRYYLPRLLCLSLNFSSSFRSL